MLSSLQPSRPKAEPPRPLNPLSQQQIRQLNRFNCNKRDWMPKTQIQAMPPYKAPLEPPNMEPQYPTPTTMYNPATMHPVFFTPTWRRPPFPMPLGTGLSPVATGYVFGDNRKRTQSMTKL